jgi:thiamine biosynthesis lipoprotein
MILDYMKIPNRAGIRYFSWPVWENAPPMPLPWTVARSTPPPPATLRRLRIALGTGVAIEATAESTEAAQDGLESAFAAVEKIDRLMHPRRDGSDLARIHAAAPGVRVPLHHDTWDVLVLARRVHEASGGVFDPCVAGCFSQIELGSDEPFAICHAPASIDLGGIAKGYAVDRAVEALRTAGCSSGLVNAGGDLRVFGPQAHTVFVRIGVAAHPVGLLESALAVSDMDAPQRPSEHRGYYVGRSTDPSPTARYAAVVAHEAAVADALTKCVLLCSRETTARALQEFGASQMAFDRERP